MRVIPTDRAINNMGYIFSLDYAVGQSLSRFIGTTNSNDYQQQLGNSIEQNCKQHIYFYTRITLLVTLRRKAWRNTNKSKKAVSLINETALFQVIHSF
jgi:hypothetical protein